MAILIILAELSLAIFIFYLINLPFQKLFKYSQKIPLAGDEFSTIKALHRNIKGMLQLACIIACLAIVGINIFLLYQGEKLVPYKFQLINRIPPGFWVNMGIALLQSLGIVIVAALLIRILEIVLDIACIRAQSWEQSTIDDNSIQIFFKSLKRIAIAGIWLLSFIWCGKFFQVPIAIVQYLLVFLRIYLILAVGLLSLKVIPIVIDKLEIFSLKRSNSDKVLHLYQRLRHIIPFLKRSLKTAIYAFMAMLIVQQIDFIADLALWGSKIIQLIAIIFVSYVLVELTHLFIEELLLRNDNMTELERQRKLTIIPLLKSSSKYLIYFGAGIFILETFSVDPTPILAAAGIVGLAASLGAQNLVNDLVSGFFILFDNYYLVGDYIAAGNLEERQVEGFVEAIELRTTRLRHPNGQLQIIHNGKMGSIINYSKNYIYAVVEIRLSYEVNLEQIYNIIDSIGQRLYAENPEVLEPTEVDGIEEFGEYYLLLGTRTKVKPGNKLKIERLIRKNIQEIFTQEGISIPIRPQD